MTRETAGPMVFRPFGLTRDHMDIDFGQPCRPRLVTQLLHSCAQSLSEDDLWALTVSARIEALLHIALPHGNDRVDLPFQCPLDTCGEPMEVELSRDEILERCLRRLSEGQGEAPPGPPIRVTVNGAGYFFRKPTGKDQLKWLEASFTDEETARAAMIRTLCLDPDLPLTPACIAAVDEGMRDADPLVYFTLTVACPACEEENVSPVDLENLLIRRLQNAQKALLDTVHRLASRYHWSEAQVLDVPPHRRTYYLERIDNGE